MSLLDEDRLWFKSSEGFGGEEMARELTFCAHAILAPETTVVGDARDDNRLQTTRSWSPLPTAPAERNAAPAEPFDLSLSLGLAEAPAGEASLPLADLLAAADAAMYETKRERRAAR